MQINLKYRTMKKFREFLKGIITEEKKYSWETEGYTKIEYPKELKEQYKKLQNLKGEEQDAAIAALSDELKASLIEYGNEVSTHYGDYFFHFYEMADDYRWYSSERAEYIGDQNRFNRLLQKLNGDVVKEDVNTQPEITQLPKAGNIRWGFLLIPNHNNFIYHTLKNLRNEHDWRNIDNLFAKKLNGTPSKLSALISSKKPVTLAVATSYENTVVLYPNAIIDSVEGEYVTFHLDPKQYRTIKEKFGYNIQTTSLSLQWIKKHPEDKSVQRVEHTNSTTGFELIKGDRYWYKVYGKEKGQLHQFTIRTAVMLWEDLQEIFDIAIDWFDALREAEWKLKEYEHGILKRGEEIFKSNDELILKLYSQVRKHKYEERDKFLETLPILQLKDIWALALYRWSYHYKIYAQEHKVAEMADDYRAFSSLSNALLSIRDRDGDISARAKRAFKKKEKEQNE